MTISTDKTDEILIDAKSPERFFNRELSWLDFNQRVLDEANNQRHPLLERLRFLSISASNLDEFFMVRVAGIKVQVKAGVSAASPEGLSPSQQLQAINRRAAELMRDQQACWHRLRGELRGAGIAVVDPEDMTAEERAWTEAKFRADIYPVLTPLAIDPAHPFPFIPNLGFALALRLSDVAEKREIDALVPLPAQLERFIRLPGAGIRFVLLEQVVLM